MTEYVVGFLFDVGRQRVVLVKKKRPAWQAGRYNGVGGHVEPGETPALAMQREFAEEAGLHVEAWLRFAELHAGEATIHFFRAFGDIDLVQSRTDEEVGVFPVDHLANVLPNLRWLIAMALSMDAERASRFIIIEEYV